MAALGKVTNFLVSRIGMAKRPALNHSTLTTTLDVFWLSLFRACAERRIYPTVEGGRLHFLYVAFFSRGKGFAVQQKFCSFNATLEQHDYFNMAGDGRRFQQQSHLLPTPTSSLPTTTRSLIAIDLLRNVSANATGTDRCEWFPWHSLSVSFAGICGRFLSVHVFAQRHLSDVISRLFSFRESFMVLDWVLL